MPKLGLWISIFCLLFSLTTRGMRPQPWIPCYRWVISQEDELSGLLKKITDPQLEVLGNLIHIMESRGIRATHDNTHVLLGIPYSKLVGRAQYRPEGKAGHLRIFDSPHEFWMAFDWLVENRLLYWEAKAASRMLDPGEKFAQDSLKDFDLWTIEFRRDYENGEYPKIFLDYLREKRNRRLPRLIHLAVSKYEKEGTLVTSENAQEITGLSFEVLMGVDFYTPGKEGSSAHKRGVEGGAPQFWRLFDTECKRRYRELGKQRDRWDRLTPVRYARLGNFSIFRVHFKCKEEASCQFPAELLSLFDEHRSKEQVRVLNELVDRFEQDGALIKANTARADFDRDWYQLMGRENYSMKSWGFHRRIFNCPAHFWIEFDREVRSRIRRLQQTIRERSHPMHLYRLRKLQSFTIDDVRFVGPVESEYVEALRALYRRHQVEPTFRVQSE